MRGSFASFVVSGGAVSGIIVLRRVRKGVWIVSLTRAETKFNKR